MPERKKLNVLKDDHMKIVGVGKNISAISNFIVAFKSVHE